MTSPLDPARAPVGDVAAALMQVDSLLARLGRPDQARRSADRSVGVDAMVESVTDLDELIDGFCTLIYLYLTGLRQANEAAGRDVIEDVLPTVVQTLRMMTTRVAPEAIPTMTGLVTAAAMQLSPSLWRRQLGSWAEHDMNALEATALVLAEQINQRAHDDRAAIRMITDALALSDDDS